MNNKIKFIASTLFVLCSATYSFAQVSATATATSTVVTPITISKTVDMNFGNVAVSGTGGAVILAPAGTRTFTGGVTLPATAGTISAASFTVSGLAAYTYSITLPTTATILTSGVNTMNATAFTSTPTPTGLIAAGGSQTVSVGATLTVAASQPAGTYVSAANGLTVTVNYN